MLRADKITSSKLESSKSALFQSTSASLAEKRANEVAEEYRHKQHDAPPEIQRDSAEAQRRDEPAHQFDRWIGDGVHNLRAGEPETARPPIAIEADYKVENQANEHHQDEQNERNVDDEEDNQHGQREGY
jgi:hypothetical protein